MGDLVSNLSLVFSVALSFQNLGLAFVGCLVGTLIGVLPGVGPIATIAMLLPITFGLDPVGALIDRKSTRLNSSHANISYAVFCLQKKIDAAPQFYFPT